jgi:hypothetical protein
MADAYTNDLRLREQEVGANSGAWGGYLNTTLENIAESWSYGTEALADSATQTLTLADGASDQLRSFYVKLTGTLSQATTVTIAPNTISKSWMIENATTGGYAVTLSQGSGANVTVANGNVKMIATDGAGAGAVVYDLFTDLELADGLTVPGGIVLVGGVTNTAGGYPFKVGGSDNQGELAFSANATAADLLSYDRTNSHYNTLNIHASSTIFTQGAITSNTLNSASGNDLRLNAGSANRDVFFQVNGSTLATLQGATGNVAIVDGNLTFASGHGIDFSATGDGTTMSSELLDDYEEGTWTPVLISGGSTNPTGGGALSPYGSYTKVGNRVTVTFYVGRSWTNTPAGQIFVSGLPFVVANVNGNTTYTYAAVYNINFGGGMTMIVPDKNAQTFNLYSVRNSSDWTAIDWTTHTTSPIYLSGQFSYTV